MWAYTGPNNVCAHGQKTMELAPHSFYPSQKAAQLALQFKKFPPGENPQTPTLTVGHLHHVKNNEAR